MILGPRFLTRLFIMWTELKNVLCGLFLRATYIHTGLSMRTSLSSCVVFRPQCPVRSRKTIVLSSLSSRLMWSCLGFYSLFLVCQNNNSDSDSANSLNVNNTHRCKKQHTRTAIVNRKCTNQIIQRETINTKTVDEHIRRSRRRITRKLIYLFINWVASLCQHCPHARLNSI